MIRRATTTLAAFAVLWLWLGASAHGGVASDPQVWIAFTNSTNGRLRSCHCPNNPFGGLDRRAWALRQIRERIAPAKLLLLDAGDLFPAQDEPELWPPLLQAYHQLDYDAVCIGDQELSVGIANWLAVVGAHPEWGIPWLAAGYVPKTVRAQGLAAFPAARVFELNGHKIGVVSVTCPGIYRFTAADNSPLTDVDIQPAAQAIADFRALHRDLDVLIVLSHQGLDTDVELAKNQPGIDVISGGHSQSLVTAP